MMDCGAACLQSISKYYGKYFGLTGFRVMAYPMVALCRGRPCKATNGINFIG